MEWRRQWIPGFEPRSSWWGWVRRPNIRWLRERFCRSTGRACSGCGSWCRTRRSSDECPKRWSQSRRLKLRIVNNWLKDPRGNFSKNLLIKKMQYKYKTQTYTPPLFKKLKLYECDPTSGNVSMRAYNQKKGCKTGPHDFWNLKGKNEKWKESQKEGTQGAQEHNFTTLRSP